MTRRRITHISCPCGHRGSIVESMDDDASTNWYFASLRGLSHGGTYDGIDELFAELTPACPKCGLSLSPEHVIPTEELALAV
jgi:hypothetical protein